MPRVVEQPRGATPDPVASGWAYLSAAEWDAARVAFTAALARGETPEALEGLGWTAWWLDDAETIFPARERAYQLYPTPTRRDSRIPSLTLTLPTRSTDRTKISSRGADKHARSPRE